MTLEIHPLNLACNIKCAYCYQKDMRAAEKPQPLDIDTVISKIDSKFTIFGGEALLTPLPVLEQLFKFGFERFKVNNIQTNGTIMTDRHIELFEKYNVSIGFSLDGPNELNAARCDVEMTKRIHRNLLRCLNEGLSTSLIVTLTVHNLKAELITWLQMLESVGLKYARIHFLENDGVPELVPDIEYLKAFVTTLYRTKFKTLQLDIFNDLRKLLSIESPKDVTCIWNSCDPYTTSAVQGLDSQGEKVNCGRTNKGEVNWKKAKLAGNERQLALYNTPQEFGGCKGCKFFFICKGECPGTGLNGDWRNRTDHCEIIKHVLTMMEEDLGDKALTLYPDRVKVAEEFILRTKVVAGNSPHVDIPHGDRYDFTVPIKLPTS